MNKRVIGKIGEDIASKYLENNGIKIIQKNYYTKFGEIDLIGIENKTIIFIEVKLRNNRNFGCPEESINYRKLAKLHNTAVSYMQEKKKNNYECRFDVVTLFLNKTDNLYTIEWLKNQYLD